MSFQHGSYVSLFSLLFTCFAGCGAGVIGKDILPLPNPVRALSPPGATYDDIPRPFVGYSVTAALFLVDASEVSKYDGEDKDNVRVDIAGQGPILWSVSRWNQGDISPRLAPRHPYAQTNLNMAPGPQGYAASSPSDFSTQAWRPSMEKGVLLATVARNGQQWDDGAGSFYGTAACVYDSQGYGYSMSSGEFGNSRPTMDVTLGKAGQKGEANIDVAVAWFPYEQGWTGGYVDAPGEYSKHTEATWATLKAHSRDLPDNAANVLRWGKRGAKLTLPGARASSDGMLFLTSTDPGEWNNDLNTMSTYFKHGGKSWRIQAREDSTEDPKKLVESSEHMFAFLYVPFTTPGLVGANVAASGRVSRGAGDFRVRRVDEGKYEVRIGRGRAAPRDGVLMLQVIGRDESAHKYARHAFLSYNYTSRGVLVVESHRLQYVRSADGILEETFPFVDTDFSFVWLDFRHPPAPITPMFTGRVQPQFSSLRFVVGVFVGVGVAAALLALAILQASRMGLLPRNLFFRLSRPRMAPPHSDADQELLGGPYIPSDR